MTGPEIVNKKSSVEFILANYEKMNNKKIAAHLGVYVQAVRGKCYELGLY